MDLDEYQRATEATDVRPDPKDPALPLLGLAGEVGSLVTEYKKKLRAGGGYAGFEREVREDLGDLLWYAATLARTVGLSLDEIASANLAKTASMWSEELSPPHQYDAAFPPEQRLPRQFTMTFVTVTGNDGLPRVKIYMGSEARGDPLDDNSYEEDHYRFHDALHLAHGAILGWSPVFRWMVKAKRKEDVLLGALVAMTVSATGGTGSLLLSGAIPPGAFWSTWSVWWTGDAMGVLIVAPFLLSLRSHARRSPMSWPRRAEAALLFAGLGVVTHVVFQSKLQIQYLVFPFLGWAAWRFRQRAASSAALLASSIAIWAGVQDAGPFAHATLVEKMVNLQVFNACAALCSVVLATVASERLRAIGEQKRAEVEMAHRALHDPLTDLANRMLFMDRLSHALVGLKRRPGSLAVLFLDLDRFKAINDTLGHEGGDRVLLGVANRIRGAVRAGDTASRFGGDEFVAICEDVENRAQAMDIAERVASAVRQPIAIGGAEVSVTVSVGVAVADGPFDHPESLVGHADAAMYRAKERGRNRCELFAQELQVRAVSD